MEIEEKYKKLNICASKDALKYSLQSVLLDRHDELGNVAVASDGRRMVVIPLQSLEDKEVGRMIPHITWTNMFRIKIPRALRTGIRMFRINKRWINCYEVCKQNKGGNNKPREILYDKQPEHTFPNWKACIPEPGKHMIAFNAKFLYEIAQAFGDDHVHISFNDKHSVIHVTNRSGDCVAALMPIRIID